MWAMRRRLIETLRSRLTRVARWANLRLQHRKKQGCLHEEASRAQATGGLKGHDAQKDSILPTGLHPQDTGILGAGINGRGGHRP